MAEMQGCVFTKDMNKAMLISDAMETGTVQINSAPARGPDHFPFQVNQTIFSSHSFQVIGLIVSNELFVYRVLRTVELAHKVSPTAST